MAQKFPFSMWNYNDFAEYGHVGDHDLDEMKIWADCGLTVPCLPKISMERTDPAALLPLLDRTEALGVRAIAQIEELEYPGVRRFGEEKYRALCREAAEKLRHPALYGFFIGDEPGGRSAFEACVAAMRIQHEEMPEASPWVNFHTDMDSVPPEQFGGLCFREWLKKAASEAGFRIFSYGHYGQMAGQGEGAIDSYFHNLKALSEAAEEAGVEMWNTQLSSAHHVFRIPTEYDFLWQITTAAACGSRGIVWFRFYDRLRGPNYHGSPVDEYGNLTEQYYRLLRCQRKFNDHWSELLMSLHHKKTWLLPSRGGYDAFEPGVHPVIREIRTETPAVVSIFTDEGGTEYLVLVDASQRRDGVYKIFFDRDRYRLEELLFNGSQASEYRYGNSDNGWDGLWLYPGQMSIWRITER